MLICIVLYYILVHFGLAHFPMLCRSAFTHKLFSIETLRFVCFSCRYGISSCLTILTKKNTIHWLTHTHMYGHHSLTYARNSYHVCQILRIFWIFFYLLRLFISIFFCTAHDNLLPVQSGVHRHFAMCASLTVCERVLVCCMCHESPIRIHTNEKCSHEPFIPISCHEHNTNNLTCCSCVYTYFSCYNMSMWCCLFHTSGALLSPLNLTLQCV